MKNALTNALAALGVASMPVVSALAGPSTQQIVLAKDSAAQCTIVLAHDAIEPEETAAAELADYLKKIGRASCRERV